MSSNRKDTIDTIKKYAKSIRGGWYSVKRGVINWATHDWDRHPNNIAIMIDDHRIPVESKGRRPFRSGVLTLEIFSRIVPSTEEMEIDDGELDTMIDDAEFILFSTLQERLENDSVVMRMGDIRVIESHDVNLKVQGIIVQTNVEF